ncbi:MAG: tRNA (adenosine(37)-N6)-threonylcarbamoyltransferase complex ATPase subunit type 1 TsaE [Candidatus Rifleibacteriota bacterium]
MNQHISLSTEETMKISENLAKQFSRNLVLLNGSMGAGKTVFTKGFAAGLGIKQNVSSPTYTIMNEYRSQDKVLYHLDLYRINGLEEVIDTGLYEILESNFPCLVEWAERVEELKKLPHVEVNITRDPGKDENYRKITWEWIGEKR